MALIDPVYIGTDAVERFVGFCGERGLRRFNLIADRNTYQALGQRVETALKESGIEVKSIILEGEEIIADGNYLLDVLLDALMGDDVTYVAVGSGTVTDITRFASHRTGHKFVSLPTAPSVDGFTSPNSPLVIKGVKRTIWGQPPMALFADIQTLVEAPHRMVAAGFGDMLAKINSASDWSLGKLLFDEPFDQDIHDRSLEAANVCASHAAEIGQQTPEGVRALMQALVDSGFCMLEFGQSHPASGAEHHASHYWEMKLLREGRPAILHGAKVGAATVHVVGQYAKLRALSRHDVMDRLEAATLPDRNKEIAAIRTGYGDLADEVIRDHGAFLNMTEAQFAQLKQHIADHWDEVLKIAEQTPSPETMAHYLELAGGATMPEALGLSAEEIPLGYRYGHYLRKRFTVMKLSRMLGLPLE